MAKLPIQLILTSAVYNLVEFGLIMIENEVWKLCDGIGKSLRSLVEMAVGWYDEDDLWQMKRDFDIEDRQLIK